ncbi:MAG: DUF1003 domain-containing protein [Candidatus Wildermuthbacteria bacterium]|nr:DUF1003 domain-containing protein [Candidatus Wildermuthbacteria bacterium]
MKYAPRNLQELKALRAPLRNVNVEHYGKLNRFEKLAHRATKRVGTMGFFLILALWTALWIGWNTYAPEPLRFDPFPAFVLWLFVSNMIQLLLLPLLLIGQNMDAKHSEARAENEYEIHLRSEQEIETIIQHLENQNDRLEDIVKKLDQAHVRKNGSVS